MGQAESRIETLVNVTGSGKLGSRVGSQKIQKIAQDKRQEILQTLAPQYDKVLKDLIQVDQIDLIVQPNALQYANPKHDITKRVTEKMNEQSK